MLGKGNSLETMVLKTIVIWILVLDPLEKISGKMEIFPKYGEHEHGEQW